MAHVLLELALAEESLAKTHLVHVLLDFVDEVLDACCTSGTVFLDSLTQLVAAQFHIMKVGNGLAQTVGNVGYLRLKLSECLASVV